jgi:caffeoyl-CoA O-methyltransferase
MLQSISAQIRTRMRYLEVVDEGDRKDSTPRARRLRQITPETGRFLALMAACAPQGEMVEIGISAGYSTLWMALAAQARGQIVHTFEIDPYKIDLARETFVEAQVEDIVTMHEQDVREGLGFMSSIALCFLDCEKEIYRPCYDDILPIMGRGVCLLPIMRHRTRLK